MHEAAIADALLARLMDIAQRERASAIRAVEVVVGALSGVCPEALRAAFEAAKQGTIAEPAALALRVQPARWRCTACGTEGTTEDWPILCERCGGADVDAKGGRDLLIAAVELTRAAPDSMRQEMNDV